MFGGIDLARNVLAVQGINEVRKSELVRPDVPRGHDVLPQHIRLTDPLGRVFAAPLPDLAVFRVGNAAESLEAELSKNRR